MGGDTETPVQDLRVSEIFLSLQGEAATAGYPTVFVRLTGCPLRCHYCDTSYAFSGGSMMTLGEIVEQVIGFNVAHVCVTGGEPMAQKNTLSLLAQLCDRGFSVSLETSGALDISQIDERVQRVMDLKTPRSGEVARNHYENIKYLTQNDQVKIVICDRDDYEWARTINDRYQISDHCELLFSPSYGEMDAATLADWILEDRLPVRFQIQLHKILWGDEPGR